jgi:hypothetical protein
MNKPALEIGAEGVDTAKVVADLQAAVDEKIRAGVYADARVARVERVNLVGAAHDGAFLEYYLRCLRDAVDVDINDFEIRERRARFAPFLIRLKKSVWGLLKFYTYRLWSQQNQVNGMLATAMEGLDEQYRERIARLEARVKELESRVPPSPPPA